MSNLHNMRGLEIPKFRAVTSGAKTLNEIFGENGFAEWAENHTELFPKHIYEPNSFLWHEGEKDTWGHGQNILIYAIHDDVKPEDVSPYEIMDFPGGLFLVATGDESHEDDLMETVDCMMTWINNSETLEYGDFPKSGMCNMPNPDGKFDKALGIAQQQIYLPLKIRS